MGAQAVVNGLNKYIFLGDDYENLRSYLSQAQREQGLIAEGCRSIYDRLLSLLQSPWSRIEDLKRREMEGDNSVYDYRSDYFIVPELWEEWDVSAEDRDDVPSGPGDTTTLMTQWSSNPTLETIATEFPSAIAMPAAIQGQMEEVLGLFRELRSGRCAVGPSKLVIGAGIMGLAGLSWFLWSKWRG